MTQVTLCKCEVRSLSSSLPEGQNLQARLDMLDQRLSCKDIDEIFVRSLERFHLVYKHLPSNVWKA